MYSPVVHLKAARLTLPTNRSGRDFVVGDLHGHYRALMALLRAASFSPARDRLFSVGDLIDRGPDSSRCLRLLNRSWFHPVLGNHDLAFVVNISQEGNVDAGIRHFCAQVGDSGGEWYMRHDRRDLLPLASKLNHLPHIITVGDRKVAFHVVHASLIPFAVERPIILEDDRLETYEDSMDQEILIFSLIGERGLWRRDWEHRAEGLATTYCGHCIVSHPKWSLSHLNLDTGAGFDSTALEKRRLTMVCHQTQELWSVSIPDYAKIAHYRVPKMKKKR